MSQSSTRRLPLPRWAVTAPAEEHGRRDRRDGLAGRRRPQGMGNGNVMFGVESAPVQFVPVTPTPEAPAVRTAGSWTLEVSLPSGVQLRL
jgi:hypothetical protein